MHQVHEVDFISSAGRIKTLVEHREQVAEAISKAITNSDGRTLLAAYKKLDEAFLNVLTEEAKLLISLTKCN